MIKYNNLFVYVIINGSPVNLCQWLGHMLVSKVAIDSASM